MAKTLFVSFFFLALFSGVGSAQNVKPAKIIFRNSGLAKISVGSGKTHSTIDLRNDVTGCAFVEGKRKHQLNADECAAPPATFRLIDATVKNNQTFLVVASEAMGNCNVCGHCGASESFALIWLELDSRLRLVNKQSVPVDDCLTEISGKQVRHNESDNLSKLRLAFKKNILTVEFEKTVFKDNSEISNYEFSHLEYNRKSPEKSFAVKTEKREKSSIGEQ